MQRNDRAAEDKDFVRSFAQQIFMQRREGNRICLTLEDLEDGLRRALDDERSYRECNPMAAVEQLRRFVEQTRRPARPGCRADL